MAAPTAPKRFRIAFSFAGEKREFVAKVARLRADRFGEAAILYDKFHEAEFAVYDLGTGEGAEAYWNGVMFWFQTRR